MPIETNPKVMAGKPVIAGTRITVELIQEKLAAGATVSEIRRDYPHLSRADVELAAKYPRTLGQRRAKP